MTEHVVDTSQLHAPNAVPMPPWIRARLGHGAQFGHTAAVVSAQHLNTVCEEARCPNRGECWSRGTATFMLLGDTCTRACAFCSVKTGRARLVRRRRAAARGRGGGGRWASDTSC
ncbi:MAG: hypothetical protein MZV65_19550 [Chromatiales bacterium]|nr:hypothetical protein [Chromatiales bacterium]